MKKKYIIPKAINVVINVSALLAGSLGRLGVNNGPQDGVSGDSKSDTYSIWDK